MLTAAGRTAWVTCATCGERGIGANLLAASRADRAFKCPWCGGHDLDTADLRRAGVAVGDWNETIGTSPEGAQASHALPAVAAAREAGDRPAPSGVNPKATPAAAGGSTGAPTEAPTVGDGPAAAGAPRRGRKRRAA